MFIVQGANLFIDLCSFLPAPAYLFVPFKLFNLSLNLDLSLTLFLKLSPLPAQGLPQLYQWWGIKIQIPALLFFAN